MPPRVRSDIRREVLNYLREQTTPVKISSMAEVLRRHPSLSELHDSDFRAVVQPMIVTGKLSYAPGLKIKLGNATE